MKTGLFTLVSTEHLTPKVALLHFSGNTDAISVPGQFVTVSLPGFFLHRPFSVLDWGPGWLELMVEQVGPGTAQLQRLAVGSTLEITTGLGNGFSLKDSGKAPLLIGGGVGVPPLYYLAKKLREQGKEVSVILGFNKKDEIFIEKEFIDLGCKVLVTTADGSYGTKGFVSDVMDEVEYSYFYTCGPLPMLKAVNNKAESEGEFSFEERMGCGFGACMGCSIKVKDGYKRVCKEGPVFERKEILWQD